MSNSNFTKGECVHCAGHMEFPASAAGTTVACPHCGEPTLLTAAVFANKHKVSRRIWPAALGVGLLVLLGLLGFFWATKKTAPLPVAPQPTTVNGTTNVPLAVLRPAENVTNNFAYTAIALQKTPGSSLVYASGKIRNLANRRRFGVKLELALLAADGRAVGTAKDYQPLLEPGGEWDFRALVLEADAVTAQLRSLGEDP